MTIPGFTAEASLSKTNSKYSGKPDFSLDEQKVFPELLLRGIGTCMARCRQDDWLCLFDCLGAESRFVFSE